MSEPTDSAHEAASRLPAARRLDADMAARTVAGSASLVAVLYSESLGIDDAGHLPGFMRLELGVPTVETSGGVTYATGRYSLATTPATGLTTEDRGEYVVVHRPGADGERVSWPAAVSAIRLPSSRAR
ncbi:MAG: hypothetical protein HY294_04325 [Candidatus Rokubacteria bacterium]|nr:hypothetical protein [Candidatus Rokubacteria bacterium]MBI3825200.1 hypothetical protein [Candidatus Rokubacteria bacterium]